MDDHFVEIVQFLSTCMAPHEYTVPQKKHLVICDVYFQLLARKLYKLGPDENLRRCVMELERPLILIEAHEGIIEGHYERKETKQKVL